MAQELESIRSIATAGASPRAILAAIVARPLDTRTKSLELDPEVPTAFGGGLVVPGQSALVVPAGNGALVNKVTPEQLVAIVASIIANARDAAEACVQLRAEVAGWKFQMQDGGAIE